MTKLKRLPKDLRDILDQISALAAKEGLRVYLVGGLVRDLILGRDIFDLDIVVESDAIAFAQKFAAGANGEFGRHHVFGTAWVKTAGHKLDFATARKEIYSHPGALPKVSPSRLSDDLFRRDFTINAMAVSINQDDYGRLLDMNAGRSDLKTGSLRVLHDKSFIDDPTRIMRAVRFQTRFGFKLQERSAFLLKSALKQNALSWVNPHRLRDELILMLQEPDPPVCMKALASFKIWTTLDPGLKVGASQIALAEQARKAMADYERRHLRHRRLDSWLLYFGAATWGLSQERLSALCDRLGLKKGEKIRLVSLRQASRRLNRLGQSLKPHQIYDILNPLSFETIVFLRALSPRGKARDNIERFFKRLAHVRLKVTGDDLKKLGLEPSRQYSRIFKILLRRKLDQGWTSKTQEMNALKACLPAGRPAGRF